MHLLSESFGAQHETGVGAMSDLSQIELNVAQTGQQVWVFLYHASLETTLEQGATARIGVIEITHIESAKILHQPGQAGRINGGYQQVNVVGYKNPTMDRDVSPMRTFSQPVGVGRQVFVAREDGLPVIAALDYMNWIPGRAESRSSGHRLGQAGVRNPILKHLMMLLCPPLAHQIEGKFTFDA